jgi:hypothetical protein
MVMVVMVVLDDHGFGCGSGGGEILVRPMVVTMVMLLKVVVVMGVILVLFVVW